jgi:hypothetical protein
MPWRAVCDVCGFEFYNTELKKRWDNLMVCSKDWEPRHPMDLIKVKKEESQNLPWTRPEPADVFISVTYADTGNNDIPDGTFNNSLD